MNLIFPTQTSRRGKAAESLRVARNALPMLLCAGVLLAAGAAAFAQPSAGMPGPGQGAHGPGHAMRHHRGGPGEGMGLAAMWSERALERVKATPEQREQIHKIVQAARADLRAQHEASRTLRAEAARVLTQATVDPAAAERVRQQMLAQHDRSSQTMMQAMLQASQVLSAEQRARLAEDLNRRRDMMQRHERERRALDAPKS